MSATNVSVSYVDNVNLKESKSTGKYFTKVNVLKSHFTKVKKS